MGKTVEGLCSLEKFGIYSLTREVSWLGASPDAQDQQVQAAGTKGSMQLYISCLCSLSAPSFSPSLLPPLVFALLCYPLSLGIREPSPQIPHPYSHTLIEDL